MSEQPLQFGRLIAGRYRIESLLGSGGHAHVYLAVQEKLGRRVALKVLKASGVQHVSAAAQHAHDVLVRRFEQEAKLISQLRDPHTITMYDYGSTDEGLLYMVCEFVQGETLKTTLTREGSLSAERVASILKQTLMSLQEAHAHGVLHRDIKPDNIMTYAHMGRRDQVKLLDFGIAKMAEAEDEESADMTAEGSLIGTPRYIAPERIRGEKLRPASDLYSLGLVAYEALTGQRILEGLYGIQVLQAQLIEPSLKLPEETPAPKALCRIINRMIEKDLDVRYHVAEQVLEDLRRPTTAPSPPPPALSISSGVSGPSQLAPSAPKRAVASHDVTSQHALPLAVQRAASSRPAPARPKQSGSNKSASHQTRAVMVSVIGGLLLAILVAIVLLCYLVFSR